MAAWTIEVNKSEANVRGLMRAIASAASCKLISVFKISVVVGFPEPNSEVCTSQKNEAIETDAVSGQLCRPCDASK